MQENMERRWQNVKFLNAEVFRWYHCVLNEAFFSIFLKTYYFHIANPIALQKKRYIKFVLKNFEIMAFLG